MSSSVNVVSVVTVSPDEVVTGDIIVNPVSIASCCSLNTVSIVFTSIVVPRKT